MPHSECVGPPEGETAESLCRERQQGGGGAFEYDIGTKVRYFGVGEYEGEWEEGNKHGRGTMRYCNKNVYAFIFTCKCK